MYFILVFLFVLNDKVIKYKKAEKLLWNLIKIELFEVAGNCARTGNCCQFIMIKQHGKEINTKQLFEELIKKDEKYKRFIPFYHEKSEQCEIKYFKCASLTTDNEIGIIKNRCSDYDTRPDFCKNFPVNRFYQDDTLPKDCGYRLRRKKTSFLFFNEKLKQRYSRLCQECDTI